MRNTIESYDVKNDDKNVQFCLMVHSIVEHYNVVPDVLVSAKVCFLILSLSLSFSLSGFNNSLILVFFSPKGLASGCPLSVIASRKELMDRMPPGVMGGTYAGVWSVKSQYDLFLE